MPIGDTGTPLFLPLYADNEHNWGQSMDASLQTINDAIGALQTSVNFPAGGGNMVVATPADGSVDIAALRALVVADIPDLPQSKITNLEIDLAALQASIPTNTSQLINDSGYITIADIPPSGVVSVFGRSGVVVAQTGDYAFSQISGVASVAQIPNLPASQITSGVFAVAQIPNLPESKITNLTSDLAALSSNISAVAASIPTKTSQLTNDSGFITAASAPVLTVFTRSGNVVAQTGDYAFSQISGVAAVGQIPSLPASQITSGLLALARGGTNADLSATGGTSRVLQQTSTGAAVTVAQLGFTDLSGTVSGAQIPAGIVSWDELGNAVGNLMLANAGFVTTFNQTSAVTWKWANVTLATATVSQLSPVIGLSGQYWTGAASAEDLWTVGNVIGTGTNPTSTLQFQHSGSTGVAAVSVPAGTLGAAGAFGLTFTGTTIGLSASGNTIGFQASAGTLLNFYNGATKIQLISAGLNDLIIGGTNFNTSQSVFLGDASNTNRTQVAAYVAMGTQGTQQWKPVAGGPAIGVAIGGGYSIGGFGYLGFSPASGAVKGIALTLEPRVNQTATATGDFTCFQINLTNTAFLGTNLLLADWQVGGVTYFKVDRLGNTSQLNPIAATASVSQSSPTAALAGRYWTGAADAADTWTMQNVLANGTNGASTLAFSHTGTTGVAAVQIPGGSAGNSLAASGLQFGSLVGLTGASAGVFTVAFTAAQYEMRLYATGATNLTQLGYGINSGPPAGTCLQGFSTLFLRGSVTTVSPCVALGNSSASLVATSGTQVGVSIGSGSAPSNPVAALQFAPASGNALFVACQVAPVINQTGSASGSYTGLLVNVIETALLGVTNKLLDLQSGVTGGVSRFSVDNIGNVNASGSVVANQHGVTRVATAAITGAVPVKVDTSNANQVVQTTTADTGNGLVVGVCVNSPGAGGNATVVTTGLVSLTLGTGTAAIGQFVIVDTTTNGRVKCTSTYSAGTVIGVAAQAQSTVGQPFNVMVRLG